MAQTFVYNSGTHKETNSRTKHLQFGLFFDGTLNNKDNTDLRLKILNQEDLKILPTDDVTTVIQKEELIRERRKRFENNQLTDEDMQYSGLNSEDINILKEKLRKIENREEWANSKDTEKLKKLLASYNLKEIYNNADKRSWADKQGVDNSLMNDYTNVARMWNSCEEKYRIYIEGIGTLKWEKDVDAGFQFGSGYTGIRGKVRRGCYELAKRIMSQLPEETDEVIEVTLDVFGFSRGAAAARNFLYEVNSKNKRLKDFSVHKEYYQIGVENNIVQVQNGLGFYAYNESINVKIPKFVEVTKDKDGVELNSSFLNGENMPKYGYLGYYLIKESLNHKILDRIVLKIRFIGIYDTVSSYEEFGDIDGIPLKIKGIEQASPYLKDYFNDDIRQLQLNNLGDFEKAVHFTAMNEHRENFSLTHFSKEMLSRPNCIEKAFPGVHCDIGGAYETGTETVDEIEVCPVIISLLSFELEKLKSKLVSDYWYAEDQLEIVEGGMADEKHKALFIKKYGHSSKTITDIRNNNSSILNYLKLSGVRFLWKEYSYIPLHFMESYFTSVLSTDDYQKIFSKSTKKGYPINKDKHPTLIQVKEMLEKYVFAPTIGSNALKKDFTQLKDKISSLRQATKDQLEERNYKVLLDSKYPDNEKLIKKLNEKNNLNEKFIRNEPIITDESVLKKLRNEYLHWSANRDWFGMDPTPDRIRKEYWL